MIPRNYINAWRASAPWRSDAMVEQDLIISRCIVEIFRQPELASAFALRGGTALHKLYFHPAGRYSEDLDLVQVAPGPVGRQIDLFRNLLSPLLGEPSRKQGADMVTLIFHFSSEIPPVTPLKLKVEINTREHLAVMGIQTHKFSLSSLWLSASTQVQTYGIEELLGTKLRALYQRRKGRDAYDLAKGISELQVRPETVARCFAAYLDNEGLSITRKQFADNLEDKRHNADFMSDISVLLADGQGFEMAEALDLIEATFLPWLA